MQTKTLADLKRNLKKDFGNRKRIKLAILGDCSTQLLAVAIRGQGYDRGLNIAVFDAEYDQIERQVFDTASEFYAFVPDVVIIVQSVHKLNNKFAKLLTGERATFAKTQVDNIESLYKTIAANISCKCLVCNFPETRDAIFGNFSNKVSASFGYQLRTLNFELMKTCQQNSALYVVDLAALEGLYGSTMTLDRTTFITADMIFSMDFLPILAQNIVALIGTFVGIVQKCIILDLDNTVWGGIIGDDGIDKIEIGELGIGKAFSEIQRWAKQLKERGVILAVCSKNDERIAREPFKSHPEMVLHLEDIAVFVANWDTKVDNIRYIQQVLNIGFDSIVFIDDSPFERNMVREAIPEICVPELPEDPAGYLPYLNSLTLFETTTFTDNDESRTKQYQEEAQRVTSQKTFANEKEYLESLNMIAHVRPFDSFSIPRVAQLSQRSNQFNLRTVRYDEADIERLANSSRFMTLAIDLKDKYGDYGLISAIILELKGGTAFIDTWIMSCRVLKRGVESFVLNEIVSVAKKKGIKVLQGEYIPTQKNGMVKDHYKNLGFTGLDKNYQLFIDQFTPLHVLITSAKY